MNRFIRPPMAQSPCSVLKPCLNTSGQGVKVAYALNFVIRKLDAKVIFESRKQFERLQTVDLELLVKIIAGRKAGSRNFEMCRGEI